MEQTQGVSPEKETKNPKLWTKRCPSYDRNDYKREMYHRAYLITPLTTTTITLH
ncbi:6976_t:CDS:2 [Cetraspora pellucida]|uniref:6976_t:CDS:1 n=1 Tax=Cetraspora pellucida TaxID=1433469 RepID=A0A9N9FUS4_9GLOM|nr:6976_t:CDS:2 [Cetraspora pellucida]